MKWLKTAWNWLSGKKTATGAALLLASQYVADPFWKPMLELVGQLLTAGGLIHKGVKSLPTGLRPRK